MNVYWIEDTASKHKLLAPLIEALNQLDPGDGTQNWSDGFAGRSANECCTTAGIEKALNDSKAVILLDVNLGGGKEGQIAEIQEKFSDVSAVARTFETHKALEDLKLNTANLLAVWILSFALAKGRKVVVTSTGGAEADSCKNLGVATGRFPDTGSRTRDEQLKILAGIIINAVSGYHKDPWVNEFIKQWMNGYRSLKDESEERAETFCDHESLPDDPERYSRIIGAMFGLKEAVLNDDAQGRKALLELEKKPSLIVEPTGWFEPWTDAKEPVTERKPIRSASVKRLFETACGCSVEIDVMDERGGVAEELRLPVRPALSFVAALRLLVQALREQPGGSIFAETMSLFGRSGMYQLSIALPVNRQEEFGVAKTWMLKCERGGAPITTNGVCAALWNLSQAKVMGVTETVARNDVEKALLGVFQGPGRPVAAVGFAPHFIQLYWRTTR